MVYPGVARQDGPVIKFSMAGIPVAVRPSFWLVAVLLGLGLPGPWLMATWVAIVFVSVLAHELGHALLARRFGAEVSITLTTLGGFTRWSMPEVGMSPGRRAVVAAAGSAVGIIVGLAVWGSFAVTGPWGRTTASVVLLVVWVNLGWGIINWLPIRPLDGGHMVLAFLDIVAPRKADRIASVVFVVTSVAAVGAALYFRFFFAAALAGFMAWIELSRHLGPTDEVAPMSFSYDDTVESGGNGDQGDGEGPDPALGQEGRRTDGRPG